MTSCGYDAPLTRGTQWAYVLDMAKRKPKPRTARFHLFLSTEERAQLDAAAAEQGLSRADVLRQSFRNYPKPKET